MTTTSEGLLRGIRGAHPPHTSALMYLKAGQAWTDRIARLGFPILLEAALRSTPITYKAFAHELLKRHREPVKLRYTLYGKPAGKIGFALEMLSTEWGRSIPPLNVVIVNAVSKVAGDGADYFIRRFKKRSRISEANRVVLAQQVLDQVFEFARWKDVADYFGVRLNKRNSGHADSLSKLALPRVAAPIGGESEEHKKLKRWVARHPKLFVTFGRFRNGIEEYMLKSCDEVDVLFRSKTAMLAIEVKAAKAPDGELARGVFQCVKYRAVLRAMQLSDGEPPVANCALVIQRPLPEVLIKLAKRLGVVWRNVGTV